MNSKEQQQKDDIDALLDGKLPSAAVERCSEIARSSSGLFSSTLSIKEFLCVQNTGVKVLAQVMGTSFMPIPALSVQIKQFLRTPIGGQTDYSFGRNSRSLSDVTRHNPDSTFGSDYRFSDYAGSSYSEPFHGELYDFTICRHDARARAIARMKQEASLLGASGVVGVKFERNERKWGATTYEEFTAFGTAILIPGLREAEPFTSMLSGQDFWKLWQAGFTPRGIVLGVCSYTDSSELTALSSRFFNEELSAFTNCFYEARTMAMDALHKDVRKLGATGAIGVTTEYDFLDMETEIEVSEGVEIHYLHLITNFVLMGTAIARRSSAANSEPLSRPLIICDLKDLPNREF